MYNSENEVKNLSDKKRDLFRVQIRKTLVQNVINEKRKLLLEATNLNVTNDPCYYIDLSE